ncbi:hypothetical protein ACLQ24_00150 [Micromonospora sp. DT4]|uniref:hypothetical protein n=1 Tax=Micromonospora sp. DT4 TaxID=3393438 RepID=UPI003CF99CFA
MRNTLLRAHTWVVTRTGGTDATDRGEAPIPGLVMLVGGIAVAIAIVTILTTVGSDLGEGIRDAVR